MYYLEAKKVPEYYFMKGGIREYQKHMTTNYKRENQFYINRIAEYMDSSNMSVQT